MKIQEAFPPVISNSFLEEVSHCPRKAQLRYGFGLSPAKTSVYLVAGGEFARGQEARRKAILSGLDEVEAIVAGLLAIQSVPRPPAHELGAVPPTHTRGEVLMAFIFACLKEPLATEMQTMQTLRSNAVEGVEFSFLVGIGITHPVTEDEMMLSGRLDAFEDRPGTGLWGVDDKFVSKQNSYAWEWSPQFIAYGWAHTQYGIFLPGFVVKETSAAGMLSTTVEHIIPRDEMKEKEWLFTTRESMERMAALTSEGRMWPTLYDKGAFACKRCEYRTVCSNPGYNPEDPTLPLGFKRVFWDPVNRTEKAT